MWKELAIIGCVVTIYTAYKSKDWLNQFKTNLFIKLALAAAKSFSSTSSSFTINDGGKSASLVYTHMGREFILNVPYNRRLIAKMNKYNVYVLRDDVRIDISQQSAVPYFITAEMLGGSKIIMVNKDTGEETIFEKDEAIDMLKFK